MASRTFPRVVKTGSGDAVIIPPPTPWRRADALTELTRGCFDLLIIGAGIIGSRIALEASAAGLRVALLDARDLGGATSAASSKLVHGGLRYLATGDIRRVREAHHERRVLVHRVAPHLVRPLPFLLPAYRGGPHRAPTLAAGLLLYASLSAFRDAHARLLTPARACRLVPALRTDDCIGAGLFMDATTHDHRLCLATARGAALAGAVVLNYARVVELDRVPGDRHAATVVAAGSPDPIRVAARTVINAAGPWVDAVRRLEDPAAPPLAQLSKGVHVVLPLDEPWRAAVVAPVDRYRVTFAIPWEGMLLLGTTDTAYEGDPDAVAVTDADVAAVLDEARSALTMPTLAPGAIRATFAGLRVLPRLPGGPARAPRERLLVRGPTGMVSVAGGKLTTHRRIAHETLAMLRADLGVRHLTLSDAPLPGGTLATPEALRIAAARLERRYPALDPSVCRHLVHLYGSDANRLVARGAAQPGGLERIDPRGPDIWAQVHRAVDEEWALTPDDVLRRRTTVGLRGLAEAPVIARVAALLRTAGGPAPL